MPRESVHEQIARILLAKLQDGPADPWHLPDGVARVRTFATSQLDLNRQMIYLIRPEDETTQEQTSGAITRVAEFYILAAKKFLESGVEPWGWEGDTEAFPIMDTVKNRMVKDVEDTIQADVQLRLGPAGAVVGGHVENTVITDIDRTILVEAWALVLFRIEVTYDTSRWAS